MARDEKVTTEQPETTKTVTTEKNTTEAPRAPQRRWLVPAAIASLAVVGILFIGAAIGVATARNRTTLVDRNFGIGERMMRGGSGLRDADDSGTGMMRGGMGGTTTDSTTRAFGVVTAIDGSTITIAGQGSTKKITTNDSTQYFGAAQPVKVNDTIMVIGSTSGDTFTAGRITIQRQ